MSRLSDESKSVLRFVRARLDERFAALAALPAAPDVRVENQVDVAPAAVNVTVNTEPIAEAIAEAIGTLGLAITEALVEALVEALARMPAPQVTVEAPVRPARRVTITHSDGSTSTVSEG